MSLSPRPVARSRRLTGGRIVRGTRLAHAAPGKPDREVDTRPLVPLWKQARRDTHTGPAHQQ